MRELMLIIHFIGLAMALGAGFANVFLGAAASKLEPAERGRFMAKTMILGRMGQSGLLLLLLSGFYLIGPYRNALGDMPTVDDQARPCGALVNPCYPGIAYREEVQKRRQPCDAC